MSFQVLINEVDYTNKAQLGFVLNDTLTEELDSLEIILNNVSKTLFEPFQKVKIVTTELTYYFYVNTYVENVFDYDSPMTYSYSLSLISRTKILERVILPNLKITKPRDGQTKTIKDYITNVVYPYIYRQFDFLSLDTTEINKLTMNCPEIGWNHPSAKQVLNDLLGTIQGNPCIVRVTDNKITYLSLAKKGWDIDEVYDFKTISEENYEQMENYANNITMDVQNIIPSTPNIKINNLSVRANGSARLTSDNASLYIPDARIESIKKLEVTVNATYIDNIFAITKTEDVTIDITNCVKEMAEYNAMPVSTSDAAARPCKARGGNMYFSQGGNVIHHANIESTILGELNFRDLTSVSKYYTRINNGVREWIFNIEFSSIGDCRAKAIKTIQEDVDTSLYQAQNQETINMKSLMQVQRSNVNRLGNETMVISAICDYGEIPQLGDYKHDDTGDYILSSRQIAFYSDFVLFKGTFQKNYVQKMVYYGLSSRKRYTQLAQSGDAVIREEFRHWKAYISKLNESGNNNYLSNYLAKFYSRGSGDISIKAIDFKTDAMDSTATLRPYVFTGDRTVTITAQCEDNYSIGMKVAIEDEDYVQDYVTYVDSKGEFTRYGCDLSYITNTSATGIENSRLYPSKAIGHSDGLIAMTRNNSFYKDNRETFKITYQLDFVSEDEDIIVGDGIGFFNSFVNDATIQNCKIYASTTEYISKEYPILTSSFQEVRDFIGSINNNRVRLQIINDSQTSLEDYKSFALVDSVTGNMILGFNDTSIEYFYINAKTNI